MKNDTIEMLVLEYIRDDLTADREESLKALLQKHGYEPDELSHFREIYKRLDNVHIPQAGEKMTEGFYQMLEAYQQEETKKTNTFEILMLWWRERHCQQWLIRMACAMALISAGWLIGLSHMSNQRYEDRLNLMSSEIREMKGMMAVALLNQSSANERMRAIHQINTSGSVDERMIALLVDTLGHDSNANVRMVALEALAAHADVPGAKEGLIQSLDRQESPLVQLALTDVLVRLKAKQAVGQFQRLLQKKDLNDVVRTRIDDSLKMLM
jgi:hypothetical protein